MNREEAEAAGWRVKQDENGTFRLVNGCFDYIYNFKSEEAAWFWLRKVKEPRNDAYFAKAAKDKERHLRREHYEVRKNK